MSSREMWDARRQERTRPAQCGLYRPKSALSAACAVAASLLFTAQAARAEGEEVDAVDACLSLHSEGQELRLGGKLLESREAFRQCSAAHCPSQVQRDCIGWLEQVQLQIPSVGFRVTADGASRADVRVFVDGKLLLEGLDGKAIQLNPGPHELRIELEGYQPFEQPLVLSEGDKFRMVDAVFAKPTPARVLAPMAPPPQPEETHRPVPVSSYVFGGLSLAGAISGVAWGLSSWALRGELEAGCAPRCPEKSVKVLRQRALVADISWGVSAASFVTASVFYFLRPEEILEREQDPLSVDVTYLPSGGLLGTVTVQQF